MTPDNQRLAEHLSKNKAKFWKNDTALFLCVLDFVHSEHPDTFGRIRGIHGTRRVYFADTRETIEASGENTMPERISGSDFWAYTNDNTGRKRQLCEHVLTLFGYSLSARAVLRKAFDEINGSKRSSQDLL